MLGTHIQDHHQTEIVVPATRIGLMVRLRPMPNRLATYEVLREGDNKPIGYLRREKEDLWIARNLGSGRNVNDDDCAQMSMFADHEAGARWLNALVAERARRAQKARRDRLKRWEAGKECRRYSIER